MTYNAKLWNINNGPAASSTTISAAGHHVSLLFSPIPGKTIDRICFYCTASSSGIVDVRLETVSSCAPSGSLVAANTSLTNISCAANTLYDNVLTASYAVPTNTNTLLAARISYVSGATIGIRRSFGTGSINPRIVAYTGSITNLLVVPAVTIRYSDGSYHPGCLSPNTIAQNTYTSASNPNEYGNKFAPTENLKVVGICSQVKPVASSTAVFRIYDDANNVLTTDSECTITLDAFDSTSGSQNGELYFRTPLYLTAGRTYYVSVLATAATSNNSMQARWQFTNVAMHDAFMPDVVGVTRNGGAWTETTTDANMITPIYDSSFGLNHRCMSGGVS